MDYRKIYVCLIETRKATPTEDTYYEQHHIIPKSEGGSDDERNIVKLTAREHYIAHLLLAKIYDDSKMLSALVFMRSKPMQIDGRIFRFNSHLFDKIRKKANSKKKGVPHSKEHCKKISEAHKGKHLSLEHRQKISDSCKGIPLSLEHRQKISERTRDALSSSTARNKLSEVGKKNKGRHWYNNGTYNVFRFECPEGYVKGFIAAK